MGGLWQKLTGGGKEAQPREAAPRPAPKRKPDLPPHLDPLTEVYTRSAIEAEMEAAIEAAAGGERVAVGFVAIDDLATVDLEFGRIIGDQCIREVARRLRTAVRENDPIGRAERDSFLIVFRGLAARIETLAILARIRVALAEPTKTGRGLLELDAACGVAHYVKDATVASLTEGAVEAMETARVVEAARREAEAERLRVEAAAQAAAAAAAAAAELEAAAAREADAAAAAVEAAGIPADSARVQAEQPPDAGP